MFNPDVADPPETRTDSPTDEIVPELIIVKSSQVAVPSPTLIACPDDPVEAIIDP